MGERAPPGSPASSPRASERPHWPRFPETATPRIVVGVILLGFVVLAGVGVVTILAAALGAGSADHPERATVRWSDHDAIVSPAQLPDGQGSGWLSVRTTRFDPGKKPEDASRLPPIHRRFAVFDTEGNLIYVCHGHSTERDVIPLPPGRYIVVATVDRGSFDHVQQRIQFAIERERTTVVDLDVVRAAR